MNNNKKEPITAVSAEFKCVRPELFNKISRLVKEELQKIKETGYEYIIEGTISNETTIDNLADFIPDYEYDLVLEYTDSNGEKQTKSFEARINTINPEKQTIILRCTLKGGRIIDK